MIIRVMSNIEWKLRGGAPVEYSRRNELTKLCVSCSFFFLFIRNTLLSRNLELEFSRLNRAESKTTNMDIYCC